MSELDKKFNISEGLQSPEPKVVLGAGTQCFPKEGLSEEERRLISQPHVIAGEAARTCYSSTLCSPQRYLDPKHRAITDEVVRSTRESGHLTTRQHVYFTFELSGVSRQWIWSSAHDHPFYNSDQVSQRYVEMKPGNYVVPQLGNEALDIYLQTANQQMQVYQKLGELLRPVAEEEYFGRIFKGRVKQKERWQGEVDKKCQEVARYVLPVATHANLYYTISALTLMRMARTCEQYDVPTEGKLIVAKMVGEVVDKTGEDFLQEIPDPIPLEETPEYATLGVLRGELNFVEAKRAAAEFDEELKGKTSKLIGYTTNAEKVIGRALRAVFGVTSERLSDDEAVAELLIPDSAHNFGLRETLNITTMSNLSRSMDLISFTFMKKLSHTGDSQDQRHRMTPAARPVLTAQYFGQPDFVTPALIREVPEAEKFYRETMVSTYRAVNQLLEMSVPFEKASYLLPNAQSLRFVEQGTLLNLHHKARMRLCFNAQEEIWRATLDEVEQIGEVYPQIGEWLLPPCTIRLEADQTKPYCPEGKRFCGVPVWNLPRDKYRRLI